MNAYDYIKPSELTTPIAELREQMRRFHWRCYFKLIKLQQHTDLTPAEICIKQFHYEQAQILDAKCKADLQSQNELQRQLARELYENDNPSMA